MATSYLLNQTSLQNVSDQSQINRISEREHYWKNKMNSQQALYNSNHPKKNNSTNWCLIFGLVFFILIIIIIFGYLYYKHKNS
jgi:quinol-cytochrome oxidoreductase complex cytochrome b subunit